MPADDKSLPHQKGKPFKHAYICARAPELRVVYKRKGQIEAIKGGTEREVKAEKYLGFIRMAIGGVFQTNDDDIAEYIEGLEWFGTGAIKKVSHDELTNLLLQSGPEADKVSVGPLGVGHSGKPEPVAPAEEAPRVPAAAVTRGIGAKSS